MNTARNGAARERRIRDYLTDRGWTHIMRSAASKGPADLLVAHPTHGAALIQVGTTTSKRLGPEERERFLTAAELCGALPLVALCAPGLKPRFLIATREIPSRWDEYHP